MSGPEVMANSFHPADMDGRQVKQGDDLSVNIENAVSAFQASNGDERVFVQVEKNDAINEATLMGKAPEEVDIISPNDNSDELVKPTSEDSTEFQFDSKSEPSPNGEFVDIDSSNISISSNQDDPVIQERDDQLCMNSPKQEVRLDISPKQGERLNIHWCQERTYDLYGCIPCNRISNCILSVHIFY